MASITQVSQRSSGNVSSKRIEDIIGAFATRGLAGQSQLRRRLQQEQLPQLQRNLVDSRARNVDKFNRAINPLLNAQSGLNIASINAQLSAVREQERIDRLLNRPIVLGGNSRRRGIDPASTGVTVRLPNGQVRNINVFGSGGVRGRQTNPQDLEILRRAVIPTGTRFRDLTSGFGTQRRDLVGRLPSELSRIGSGSTGRSIAEINQIIRTGVSPRLARLQSRARSLNLRSQILGQQSGIASRNLRAGLRL